MAIDTIPVKLPGVYFGATAKYRDSSLTITSAKWNSTAWNAGLREKDIIVETNGANATADHFKQLLTTKKTGDSILLVIAKNNTRQQISVTLATKFEKPFTITPLQNQTALQKEIYQGWLNK